MGANARLVQHDLAVATATRLAPGGEVDSEGDLLGHRRDGVIVQRLLQRGAHQGARLRQALDAEAVQPLRVRR